MAENCDVAGIADFFRQISCIVNELWTEVGVFFLLRQKPKVYCNPCFTQGVIDKARMTCFITRHKLEQLCDFLVRSAALHFFVQYASRKFSGTRTDQEIDKLFLQLGVHPVPVDFVPVCVFLKMSFVWITDHAVN